MQTALEHVEQIRGEQLYRIKVSTPFPMGDTNVYVVEENGKWLMFDVGSKRYSDEVNPVEMLFKGLKELKDSLGMTGIDHVVISHCHPDHVSGLAEFLEKGKELFGSGWCPEVVVHKDLKEMIESYRSFKMKRSTADMRFLRESGLAEVYAERGLFNGTELDLWRLVGEETDRFYRLDVPRKGYVLNVVQPDQELLGGTLLTCPGHHQSNIGFLWKGYLFGGDCLWGNNGDGKLKTPNPFCKKGTRERGLEATLHTLDALYQRDDIDLVLPGHGRVIPSYKEDIEKTVRLYYERSINILKQCNGERTVKEIAERIWHLDGTTEEYGLYLACSETLGHLEVLEEIGLIKSVTGIKGALVFSKIETADRANLDLFYRQFKPHEK